MASLEQLMWVFWCIVLLLILVCLLREWLHVIALDEAQKDRGE